MSGPWEKFQSQSQDSGPWDKFSATAPKGEIGVANLGPKDVPESPPSGTQVQNPQTNWMDLIRGAPGAIASMGIGTVGQLAGRAIAPFSPETGKKVAETISYTPSEKGQETLRKFQGVLEKSKLEGLGPMVPSIPGATGATKVLAGKPVPEIVSRASKAGLRVTPEEAGAGPVARTAASLSGEPRLSKLVSKKNEPILTGMIAEDLGLPKETPITRDSLAQVRAEAGKAYEAVRNSGRVATDVEYTNALDKLGEKYRSAASDFPTLAKADVEKVIKGLKQESFDANSGVDMIRQLRESADQAYRTGDTGMGKVLRGGADAIESQLDRHMTKRVMTGADPASVDMLRNFKAARERIAKSYMAEKALVGETGNINPQAYATALAKRKPLSGGAKEVGELAGSFPRSAQKPVNTASGPSWGDILIGELGKNWLLGAARPVARSVLSSGPYNRLQASQPSAGVPIPSPEALKALQVSPLIGQQQ